MLSMITLPDPGDILSSSADWANTFFAEWLPVVYIAVGITAAVMFVWLLRNTFINGFHSLTHGHTITRGGETAKEWEMRELADARKFGGWRG